jgi:AcrR family transcriptional regulator
VPAVSRTAIGSRRGPTKGDQREQALLAAARLVFREKPISQVTIDELAGAAGIARSGFYFYFESKQALLAALTDQAIGEGDQEMAESLRRGMARALARWRVEGRWLSEVFIAPDPGPDVRHVRDRVVETGCSAFSDRIERDAKAGLTVDGPPGLLARMAVHLRIYTLADAFADPDAHPEDALLDTLTDATLRLVYGATPGKG